LLHSPDLLHADVDSEEVVGLFISSHGCQYYTALFFEGLGERSGKVWRGDICEIGEIEDWEEEGKHMADSWTEWLRKLSRGGTGK